MRAATLSRPATAWAALAVLRTVLGDVAHRHPFVTTIPAYSDPYASERSRCPSRPLPFGV